MSEPAVVKRQVRQVVIRVLLVVVALGVSAFVLVSVFDDLDWDEVVAAVRGLEDAELAALVSTWLLWIAAQGLQTASLIDGLPVRRGVVAFLGPAAIASLVPGPSDLPVRHRMLTSWGRSMSEATLAVAAGGIFNIGIKLVLPVVAAIGLVVSDSPIDGTLRTIVTIALLVGLGLVVVAWTFGSERRTARAGRLVEPVWRFVLRLLRKGEPEGLAERMVEARSRSLGVLRRRWPIATWATFLTATARFVLLLMALRFMGVGEDVISWTEVFVVFAIVQGLTVIPITAGDAGVSEVAYIGLLTAAAGSAYVNQITAAVLVFRILTWLIVIPVGFGALAVWRRSVRPMLQPAHGAGDPDAVVEPDASETA